MKRSRPQRTARRSQRNGDKAQRGVRDLQRGSSRGGALTRTGRGPRGRKGRGESGRPPWQKKLNWDRESSARDGKSVGRQRRRRACAAFQSRARGEDAKVIGVGILQVRQEWSATVTGRSKLWTRYRTWPLSFSGPVTRTISCCRRRRHRSVVKGAPIQICKSRLVVMMLSARLERTSLRVE